MEAVISHTIQDCANQVDLYKAQLRAVEFILVQMEGRGQHPILSTLELAYHHRFAPEKSVLAVLVHAVSRNDDNKKLILRQDPP